jgi:RNA polymerase sigma-70 factor (ECF subfamily)
VFSQLSSSELLRLCVQRAPEEAWGEFMRRYHPVIARNVARIARQYDIDSPATIEDMVQEVYVKLCDRSCRILREFRDDREDALYAFLKVVSANIARDRCHAMAAMKRGGGKVVPLTADDDSLPADDDFGSRLVHGLFIEKVEAVVTRYTEGPSAVRDQSIFWLYYRQGMTAREIAAIPAFELTAKGVESLLQRLVRQVRTELVETAGESSAEGSATPKPFV